jgi:hypothetical protein
VKMVAEAREQFGNLEEVDRPPLDAASEQRLMET